MSWLSLESMGERKGEVGGREEEEVVLRERGIQGRVSLRCVIVAEVPCVGLTPMEWPGEGARGGELDK
jgi:hypothetical protein